MVLEGMVTTKMLALVKDFERLLLVLLTGRSMYLLGKESCLALCVVSSLLFFPAASDEMFFYSKVPGGFSSM